MLRDIKQLFFDQIAEKLNSNSLSSKDWWTSLKTYIVPNLKLAIPRLEFSDGIYTEDCNKANIFNTYFQSQTSRFASTFL